MDMSSLRRMQSGCHAGVLPQSAAAATTHLVVVEHERMAVLLVGERAEDLRHNMETR